MGLLYTASFRNITLGSVAADIISLRNSASATLRIHQLRLSSNYTSDERLDLALRIFTGSFTIGSGGTTATPSPRNGNNTIASKITRFAYNDTTAAVVGTGILYPLEADQWSELAPIDYLWTPETRPEVPVSGLLTLNLANSLAAAGRVTNGFITWEEN